VTKSRRRESKQPKVARILFMFAIEFYFFPFSFSFSSIFLLFFNSFFLHHILLIYCSNQCSGYLTTKQADDRRPSLLMIPNSRYFARFLALRAPGPFFPFYCTSWYQHRHDGVYKKLILRTYIKAGLIDVWPKRVFLSGYYKA